MVAQQARERAVLVAMKNKEREIAVEIERVERARQMEVTTRENDVIAQQITRQAEIERQRLGPGTLAAIAPPVVGVAQDPRQQHGDLILSQLAGP